MLSKPMILFVDNLFAFVCITRAAHRRRLRSIKIAVLCIDCVSIISKIVYVA
jgi:hypothetical protein